jgi:replicative DNA helicase
LNPEYEFSDAFCRKILAVLAMFPRILTQFGTIIQPEYFPSHVHQVICRGVLSMSKYKTAISAESLETCVKDLIPSIDNTEESLKLYQQEIKNIYQSNISDHKFVVDRIILFAQDAALEQAIVHGAEMLDKKETEYKTSVRKLVEDAMRVGADQINIGQRQLSNLDDRIEKIVHPELSNCVPTGLTHLDMVMGGYGPSEGELNIILGPEKAGKSIILLNIALGAIRAPNNKKAVLYTLEMSEDKYLTRLDCRLAGKDKKFIRQHPDEFRLMVTRKHKTCIGGDLIIKQYPTKSASVDDFRAHLAMLEAENFIPDLVVVDYTNIVKPRFRSKDGARHDYASIYTDLRRLAGEMRIPIWSADQATRAAHNKKIIESTGTSEAHEKTTICDFMASLCQTKKEALQNKARLFVALSRNEKMYLVIDCRIRKDLASIHTLNVREPRAEDFIDADISLEEDSDERRKERISQASERIRRKRLGKS